MAITPFTHCCFFILLFTFCKVKAQTDSTLAQNTSTPLDSVAVLPEFKGGTEALLKFIVKNFKMPSEALKERASGTVYVRFIVEENGDIEHAEIIRSVHKQVDAEVLRVILLADDWSPALTKDGKSARVHYVLPIKIK